MLQLRLEVLGIEIEQHVGYQMACHKRKSRLILNKKDKPECLEKFCLRVNFKGRVKLQQKTYF